MQRPTLLAKVLLVLWACCFGLWMWSFHLQHKAQAEIVAAQVRARDAPLAALKFGGEMSRDPNVTRLDPIVERMIAINVALSHPAGSVGATEPGTKSNDLAAERSQLQAEFDQRIGAANRLNVEYARLAADIQKQAAAVTRLTAAQPSLLGSPGLFAGAQALIIAIAILAVLLRRHRRVWREEHNLCTQCGYDLRATPERCPECGSIPGQAKIAAGVLPPASSGT